MSLKSGWHAGPARAVHDDAGDASAATVLSRVRQAARVSQDNSERCEAYGTLGRVRVPHRREIRVSAPHAETSRGDRGLTWPGSVRPAARRWRFNTSGR